MAEGLKKVRVGRVVSNKMQKTVVVAVEWRQRHPLYKKPVRRVTKFYAHDGVGQCQLGDLVRIVESRPLSKIKRWRVVEIVKKGEVAEVKPEELDQPVLAEVVETHTSSIDVAPSGSPGETTKEGEGQK